MLACRDDRGRTSTRFESAAKARSHLVVFGAPWTDPLIEKAVASSPIRWTRESIVVGKRTFDAAKYRLAMIYPNPENRSRYIVINSGHTFHDSACEPRAGDWAVSEIATGKIVAEGFFNKNWGL